MHTDDEQSPHAALQRAPLPWWLGRGVGLALLAMVVAVGWTLSWQVAAHVDEPAAATTTPVWSQVEAYDISAVASRTGAVTSETPSGPAEVGSPDPQREDDSTQAGAGSQSQPEEESDRPTDHALQAQLLKERQQERTRRALQADQELAEFIESVGVLDQLDVWVTPISASYRITATFGQAGSLWSSDHTGVDLAAPSGTPVASVAAGTVTRAGEAGAYGLQVEVTHADATMTSYGHLSRIDVTEGQVVQQGVVVGAVGSTGNSTGPHLHLELRPAGGGPVDPVHALLARGVIL